jgi:hypothetical protein
MSILDRLPISIIYLLTVGLVLLAAEVGFRIGVQVRRRDPAALKGSMTGAVVGGLLGLLAFLLAVSIGVALDQFNTRRGLVVTEANAIGTAYLRASFLADPHATAARDLMREYVDWRLTALEPGRLDEAIRRSEGIHNQLWAILEMQARDHPDSVMLGLFVEAVNEVIDVHGLRVVAGASLRIPALMWAVFYGTAVLSFLLIGVASSAGGQRNLVGILLFALALAAVLLLLVDLDRSQQGLLTVGQKALLDLQRQFSSPMP